MAQEARLLLFDEPVNNLDPKFALLILDLIKKSTEQGASALVSMHDLNLASLYADRIAVLSQNIAAGNIVIGKPSEILRKEILTSVFEVPIEMLLPADKCAN
jgi:iron complex transport system ATP-binding protein